MTEKEYALLSNRVRVSAALASLREVTPGDEFGITDAEHMEIMSRLRKVEMRIFDIPLISEVES